MIGPWIGMALLAGSWLFGLSYYHPAATPVWGLAVLLGAALLSGRPERLPPRRAQWAALLMLLPSVWLVPWPYRAGPLLVVLGLAAQGLPPARTFLTRLGRGAVLAGTILLAQGATLWTYAAMTARSHELPAPLPSLLAGMARLLGIEAAADGSAVLLHSARQVHRLGATWDLLVDPATCCFLAGGLVLLAVLVWDRLPAGKRGGAWLRTARNLAMAIAVWLPIRAGLVVAVCLHRELRSALDAPLHVMNHFLCAWVYLTLLAGPVVLAWRMARLSAATPPEPKTAKSAEPTKPLSARAFAAATGLVFVAAAVLAAAVFWDPVGRPKAGRVRVVERHSTWEPTTRPYDTTWYGEPSGYNYAALYDYCSRFFTMSRLLESDRIDIANLASCDVLVIKPPTARYWPAEVDAIVSFVEEGGGLLLVGEHTNYDRSGTFLNDICRRFGFTYRHDLLFGMDVAYDQLYRRPPVPHPSVQHVPPMDFAVSCSIDPDFNSGRAAICSTGLWSLPPDYNMQNYFPVPRHQADMRFGAFVQLWTTRRGAGRVAAFTDSTIFSNFSTFEPGKAEMFLNMLAWLNGRDGIGNPRTPLVWLALAIAAAGAWRAWRPPDHCWLVWLAAGVCGFVLGGQTVAAAQRWAMPQPAPQRPMIRVIVDRTVSEVPLAKGGFIRGGGRGYGMLEQWIPRLGYFTARREFPDVFSGDMLLVIAPTGSVTESYREGLVRYVAAGGKLLVLDDPQSRSSTANSLLWPFGLSVFHERRRQGQLAIGTEATGVLVEEACELWGGDTLAQLDDRPVIVAARYGRGAVMAVGFASLFCDRNMGWSWSVQPDPATRARYDLLFSLVRALVTDRPLGPLWTEARKTAESAKSTPAKEP